LAPGRKTLIIWYGKVHRDSADLVMAVFAILGTNNLEKLGAAIATQYEGQFFKLSESHWFIFDKGTSVEVSNKLGITKEDGLNGVVLGISSYWGRANKQLWEWLSSREAPQDD
jgi:hypothetical protein